MVATQNIHTWMVTLNDIKWESNIVYSIPKITPGYGYSSHSMKETAQLFGNKKVNPQSKIAECIIPTGSEYTYDEKMDTYYSSSIIFMSEP